MTFVGTIVSKERSTEPLTFFILSIEIFTELFSYFISALVFFFI